MMKYILLLVTFSAISCIAQNLPKEAENIVKEGKLLYRSEMAAWHGTDLFLEAYDTPANIGGYVAYPDEDSTRCIFVSRKDDSKILGTVSFDSSFNLESASIDLTERDFSMLESDYYQLRKAAAERINSDTTFVSYTHTNFNIIPIIVGKQKKVYVLTGPQKSGVIIFGNDYLIEFKSKNRVKSVKRLHANILPMEYGESDEEVAAMHSHTKETGDFITPTDICTLMLYAKYAGWEQHIVISERYMNTWNCIDNSLFVLPTGTMQKIQKDMEKRKEEEN